MEPPATHYIDREGAALAYQVVGDGPANVVQAYEIGMHLDLCWMDPDIHHNAERIARFARTVFLQPRGFGLSEQISYTPTIEQQADDIVAVMDASGMQRATLSGFMNTCNAIAVVAARMPERINGVVLCMPFPFGWAATHDRHGWSEQQANDIWNAARAAVQRWGSGGVIDLWDARLSTPFNRRLSAMLERSSATPVAALNYCDAALESDLREVYRSVRVPARVVWFASSTAPRAYGEYVASLMPDATFQLLPETAVGSSIGQSFVSYIDQLEEMATGATHSPDADRFLGTVLFTDLVSSTELLAQVGDAKYQGIRAAHERLVRLAVEGAGGRLVSVMGDGTLSVFDGPTAAVRCAEAVSSAAAREGLTVRAGVHTGELQRDGMNITGMSVHIGARVGAAAGPGEVWVSRTVRDLVVGSGLEFTSQGTRELKGVPEAWELYALRHAGSQIDSIPIEESMKTPADRLALRASRRVPGMSRAFVRMANRRERRRARARP